MIEDFSQINISPDIKITFNINSDAHPQNIINNGVIIAPPRKFLHPSRWYYREKSYAL
jgi:hypothetical protein